MLFDSDDDESEEENGKDVGTSKKFSDSNKKWLKSAVLNLFLSFFHIIIILLPLYYIVRVNNECLTF